MPDILQFFRALSLDPEQVIEVPKIFPKDVSVRTVVREPQLAEQLVEVPTNPGYVFAAVAIKTLGCRAAAALAEQIVCQSSSCSWRWWCLQGLRLGLNSTVHIVEQIVDFPVPSGGLHDLPDPGGSSSSAVSRDERGEGVFRTVPRGKKSPKSAASPSPRVPARSSSRTPEAYGRHHSWVLVMPADAQFHDWNRDTGMTSWTMLDGWLPCWQMHADGSYVHLQSQVVYESIDEF